MPRPPALWESDGTGLKVALMALVSAAFHAALFAVVVITSLFLGRAPLPPPSYEISLVAPIIKGSPGGGSAPAALRPPPGTAAPVATAAPAKVTPPTPAKNDAMTVPTTTGAKKDSVKEALERAKLQAKLEKLAAAEASKHKGTPDPQATTGPVAANPAPAATKGAGSGDGAGNGGVDYGTLDGVPGVATYDQQIQAIVQQAWDPFVGKLDPKHPIQCSIHILIGFDGAIITPEIVTESSDASFDASALVALKKVGKLPAPPLDLKPYFAHKGTVLRFDSRTKDGSMASR